MVQENYCQERLNQETGGMRGLERTKGWEYQEMSSWDFQQVAGIQGSEVVEVSTPSEMEEEPASITSNVSIRGAENV
jgi:hypothetical protein